MIGGAIKLARGAWDLAGRALGAAGDWLRQPRDWWRVIAMGLGLVCLGFAFAFADAKRQIVVVRSECETRVVTIEREVERITRSANSNHRALQQCQADLRREVGKAVQAQKLEQEAVARAAATAAQAQRDREAWERTYRNKPATCEAALVAMEAACPTLSDY